MKKSFLLFIVAAFALVLAACGSGESATSTEGKTGDTAANNSSEKLIVAVDTSYVPFSYLDSESGEYVGFDIDIIKALTEEAGVEYELKPMDFAGIIPALQTNNIDVGIAAMTINEERKEVVDFTDGYYDAGLYVLVREDETEINGVEDLVGKKVATKQGTVGYEYAVAIEGVGEVTPFPNIDQAYMELDKDSTDAVIFDSPNVAYYAATTGAGKVKVVGDILEGQEFGIAFPKGSENRKVFNEALKTIKENGKYDEIYAKWFGESSN